MGLAPGALGARARVWVHPPLLPSQFLSLLELNQPLGGGGPADKFGGSVCGLVTNPLGTVGLKFCKHSQSDGAFLKKPWGFLTGIIHFPVECGKAGTPPAGGGHGLTSLHPIQDSPKQAYICPSCMVRHFCSRKWLVKARQGPRARPCSAHREGSTQASLPPPSCCSSGAVNRPVISHSGP